jgi:uncharacterized Zn finger protein
MWYSFRPYVPVAQRRAHAAREIAKRRKKGQNVSPIVIEGRTIARTFWGKAWCDNLESYSDYENRLPRGRTYVRNGSVVDLQIEPGKIRALVSGSSLYKITISITPLAEGHWRGIKSRCAGEIGSLVELLQGRLSQRVMEVVTSHDGGMFPTPREIKLSCSCPDWAGMCKHVAAALYGVGARLDHQPELLFHLRKVDHLELIEEAVPRAGRKSSTAKKTLAQSELAGVFGIELAEPEAADSTTTTPEQTAEPAPHAAQGSQKRLPRRTAAKAAEPRKARSAIPVASSAARGSRKARKLEVVGNH